MRLGLSPCESQRLFLFFSFIPGGTGVSVNCQLCACACAGAGVACGMSIVPIAAEYSRVLILNTGGTIGMVDKGRGLEPEPGFMEGFLRDLSMFHDKEFYNPDVHGPG